MITEEQFHAYERVRQSGVTNMLDVKFVAKLSGLTPDEVMSVLVNYVELAEKYAR